MPVAKSLPLARLTPIISMAPAPATPPATKPNNGLTPARNAPEPPAVATSASEWPANDWPRTTVNTPTTPETTATMLPTTHAMCTGPLEKKPGSNTQCTGQTALRPGSGGSPDSSMGPATTRMRPWRVWTWTSYPYSALKTSSRTT